MALDVWDSIPDHAEDSEVLAWVNEQRADNGDVPIDELPAGIPGSPEHCSLALALGERMDSYAIAGCPDFVQAWIAAFDGQEEAALDAFEAEYADAMDEDDDAAAAWLFAHEGLASDPNMNEDAE